MLRCLCIFVVQFLEEYRVTLLVGLKRHFRFKAAEGLLSKNSLRVLDYACDACLSRSTEPLNFWSKVCLMCFSGATDNSRYAVKELLGIWLSVY